MPKIVPYLIFILFTVTACFKEDERLTPYDGAITVIPEPVQLNVSYFDFETGQVLSTEGKPLAGALLELWQSNSEGWYDVQLADAGGRQLRAKLRTDAAGRFRFRTILPTSYPVPTDGPTGVVLERMGRHPMRPAHLHFIVSAPGYETVVTHLFVKGDPYLESDVVFGVKDALIVDFKRSESQAEAQQLGLTAPFYRASYDFVLRPAAGAEQWSARSAADTTMS